MKNVLLLHDHFLCTYMFATSIILAIRGCKVTQFYGYTREGDGGALYDNDWLDHTYFISTPCQDSGEGKDCETAVVWWD